MDDEQLKKKLDLLWDKVRQKSDPFISGSPVSGKDFNSAFELAHQEIQREEVCRLQERFEKEKSYWENLVTSKEEIIAQLQKQIVSEQSKNQNLKNKIEELQKNLNQLVQQSFGSLEMQKKSFNLRIEQLEKQIEENHKEIDEFKLKLQEEKGNQAKLRQTWEEKEKRFLEEKDKRESEMIRIEQDLYRKRQSELEEISQLEGNVKKLQEQISENKILYDSEKSGFESAVREKENAIEKVKQELETLRNKLDKEKEERRLAVTERERQLIQQEEDKKRLVDQVAAKENKITELQSVLDKMIREKNERENAFLKREEELIQRQKEIQKNEESFQKRREEWIHSIKDQNGQQLNVSNKIVDLIARVEWEKPLDASKSGLRTSIPPPLPPKFQKKDFIYYAGKNFWFIALGIGIMISSAIWIVVSRNKKWTEAQDWVRLGHVELMKGEMLKSLDLMEKAYARYPENPVTQSSLSMVLNALARHEMKENRYQQSMFFADRLSKISAESAEINSLKKEISEAETKFNQAKLSEVRQKNVIPPPQLPDREEILPQKHKSKTILEYEVEEDGTVSE